MHLSMFNISLLGTGLLGAMVCVGGCARKFTFDPIDQRVVEQLAPKAAPQQPASIRSETVFAQPPTDRALKTLRESIDGKLMQRRELTVVKNQESREQGADPAAEANGDQVPTWTIRLYKPVLRKSVGDDSAHKPATTLTLSALPNGDIQLHSLVDARRLTRTLFDPPLVLLPGVLTSATPHRASGSVTVLRDNEKRSRLDSGTVVAQARLIGDDRIETLLTIELSSSTTQQRREYVIASDEHNKLVVTREIESLRVNVGPLNIIDDTATWVPVGE